MAIQTLDQLVNALSAGQARTTFQKASATAEGAGTWHSLWKTAGRPAAGSNPPAYTAGSGYIPTDATTGALRTFGNPTAPVLSYLAGTTVMGATVGTLIIYDRLWACSGFGTVSTSEQSVTTPGSLDRPDANGDNVEAWGEVYTAPGATAATWTLKYVNQGGAASGRTATYTHPANAETVGQMFPFIPTNGDTGVSQVTSFKASVSSGTAGDIGVTLLRRLAEIPITAANVGAIVNAFDQGLPQVYDDACLAFMVQCSTTSTGILQGAVNFVQG